MSSRSRQRVATRYRIVGEALTYPVGASLARVQAAGGLSRMSAEERATLTMAVAQPGEMVDDLPDTSLPWLLEQGRIEPVATAPSPPAGED